MTIPNSNGFFSEDSCLPCTPEEERHIIQKLNMAAGSNCKEGDLYYIVSSRWWKEWNHYVGLEEIHGLSTPERSNEDLLHAPSRPGQINNFELISTKMDEESNELVLREHLEEGPDYTLLPEAVWKKLVDWYGGGPALPRRLISQGINNSLVVEVYPLCLQLIDSRDNSQRTIRISKKASVHELYSRVCTLLKLEQSKVHIWDFFKKVKGKILTEFDQSLEEVMLAMDQELLLEVQHDGVWPPSFRMDSTGNELALVPLEPSRSSITIAGGPTGSNGYTTGFGQGTSLSSRLWDTDSGKDFVSNGTRVDSGGLKGLHNLGNTCFMNSAVQCLVHTPQVVDYFLGDYSEEINKKNPLGMHGELAVAFGDLLRKLWSSGGTPVAPREFKGKLARFAPQFSGYNQHDSQELLAFLLDGLHEDLNRVKNKPYIETKDANGRSDEEYAHECWGNHKARNNSVIVDICQGQYKSTLVCPVCSKVSVTFDPFMYLSLPLPSTVTRTMTVTVFYGDRRGLPMPFTVTVPKYGCYKDLMQALSTVCCLSSDETILLAEVHDHRIYQYLERPFESLSSIKDDDHIVAYRLHIKHEKSVRLEIMHLNNIRGTAGFQNNVHQKLFGTPLVTCLAEGHQRGGDIQAAVGVVLAPLLRQKISSGSFSRSSKENGYTPVISAIKSMDNCDPCPRDENQTLSGMELEKKGIPSFQIALTDEKALSRNPITDDSTFCPGPCVRVLLDWSDGVHDLYDASYLENLPEVFKSGLLVKKTRQEAISLFSCLEAFLREEPLGPDDMWYCPSCKEHRQATKKLDLWKLPDVLVIHLKRFSYSRFMKNKLDTFVSFPVCNLDLSKYLKHKPPSTQSHVYELYAVSNHYGGLGGGHYTAHAKLIKENKWYHFDDSHVSPVDLDSITTSAAYLLFYRRVEVDSQMGEGEASSSDSTTIR